MQRGIRGRNRDTSEPTLKPKKKWPGEGVGNNSWASKSEIEENWMRRKIKSVRQQGRIPSFLREDAAGYVEFQETLLSWQNWRVFSHLIRAGKQLRHTPAG